MTNTVNKLVDTPVTPAKLVHNMRMQDDRSVEIIDLGNGTPMYQSIQMNEFRKFQQHTEEETQLSFSTPGLPTCNVSLQHQEGEADAISLTENSLQQADGENQGIDLNRTPQQKPKRKKHRPKVIREHKPAKTPKPVTPKPVTPQRVKKTENPPQGKRKYVRKKKDPVTNENPSGAVGDVVNPQSESGTKSVRRSLNFDSEDCQARDVRRGSEMMSTYNVDSQVRGSRMLENSLSDRSSFDLNSSVNQFDAEYLTIPQTPNPPSQRSRQEVMSTIQNIRRMLVDAMSYPQPARREEENMKKFARKNSYLNLCGKPDISLEAGQNQIASDNISESVLKGTKRYRTLANKAQVPGSESCDTSRNGNFSQEIYKKKRTNTQNERPSAYSTFFHTSSCLKTFQTAQNDPAFTFADAQRFMHQEKMRASVLKKTPPSLNAGGSNQRAPTTLMPPGHNSATWQPSTPEKPSVCAYNQTQRSHLRRSSIEDCQSSNNYKGSVPRCSQLGTIIPYQDPLDVIVQKLIHLNINEGDNNIIAQEQNALVPYVPKKRRPRPKVDLDHESDRVWRLLMGKECAASEGETGTDKEKWWEEERRIFRGRAESFIARMHLVQGDRRFSKWKGSVVDSVIGVFLTQNVSDHLSSSAFMCLAAKFPVQSRGNNLTTNVEKINMPIPSGNIMTGQGNMLEKRPCDASSVVIHETKHVDDKEMENCHESPESNTGSSTLDYLDSNNLNCHDGELGIGHESPDCGSATAVTVTSSTSGVEGEDRSLMEDVVSSQNSVVSSKSSSKCLVQVADQGKLNSLLNFDSGGMGNSYGTFTELLNMADSRGLHKIRSDGNRTSYFEHIAGISQLRNMGIDQRPSLPTPSDYLYSARTSIYKTNSHFQSIRSDLISSSCAPSMSCNYQNSVTSKFVGLQNAGVLEEGNQYEMNSCSQNNVVKKTTHASSDRTISSGFSLSDENIAIFQGREKEATFQVDSSQHQAKAQVQARIKNFITPRTCSEGYNNNNNQENTSEGLRAVETNLGKEASISHPEASKNSSKSKKVKADADNNTIFDWDSLRKQAFPNGAKKERNSEAMDSLDYEALRNADVNVIAYTIRERGMNNKLAERIKAFLNRLVSDHGSVDLEWLRDVSPDKAKDYLLSVRGLGLKSVECVRLLTLHHLAFPVDTNVGRIAVRLGWVPLQPLPESLQLHLLEMYPVLETIQKFLWPRLCKLDQRTLYELHYQLITFGKVFCTKSKPNCNACPMRGECKHFASAFASARLALPAPEEKRLVTSKIPNFPEFNHAPILKSVPHLQLEGCTHAQEGTVPRNCEPIIEEPASPEPECIEALESAIEDAFFNDPDEIPTIKLDMEEFTQNLQSYINKNMELQDGDMSKALVAITADAASIPMPKLKNMSRLRTEHQVYELPDSHPLLEGMDRRERDDPSPYLLAIWTPGETAQSTEPPKECCNSHDTGNLCKENTCFSCNSIREAQTQVVRGTILIPCRTAMRGSFPLNGTYFQVNEVFADHDSSRQPIDVPRNWIWNLPRRTVYFGTSMPTIFKGLSTEGIQHCFWRGFVCVRGFDRTTKYPKPLYARLHFPATKTTKEKRAAEAAKEGERKQT